MELRNKELSNNALFQKARRILILEDSPGDLMLIGTRLNAIGFPVELESCSKEADFHSVLEEFDPDIVLADFNLTDFDGSSALSHIAEHHQQVPVIIVTGHVDAEMAVNLIKGGALDVVLKNNLGILNASILRALKIADERKKYDKLQSLTSMLSEVSKIGGWEVNLKTGQTRWTAEVSKIYECGS